MTESPWFPPSDKPTRVGDYRVKITPNQVEYWARWSGRWWLNRCYFQGNTRLVKVAAVEQDLYWKGIVR